MRVVEHLVAQTGTRNRAFRVVADERVDREVARVARPCSTPTARSVQRVRHRDRARTRVRVVALVHAEAAVVQADGRGSVRRDGHPGRSAPVAPAVGMHHMRGLGLEVETRSVAVDAPARLVAANERERVVDRHGHRDRHVVHRRRPAGSVARISEGILSAVVHRRAVRRDRRDAE